jgi:hypothetical protein
MALGDQLNSIAVFVEVARCTSFTQAAIAIGAYILS